MNVHRRVHARVRQSAGICYILSPPDSVWSICPYWLLRYRWIFNYSYCARACEIDTNLAEWFKPFTCCVWYNFHSFNKAIFLSLLIGIFYCDIQLLPANYSSCSRNQFWSKSDLSLNWGKNRNTQLHYLFRFDSFIECLRQKRIIIIDACFMCSALNAIGKTTTAFARSISSQFRYFIFMCEKLVS